VIFRGTNHLREVCEQSHQDEIYGLCTMRWKHSKYFQVVAADNGTYDDVACDAGYAPKYRILAQ